MIFLTVGTQFSFDRLVKSVDDVISQKGFEEEVFAQIGVSSYQPQNFRYTRYMGKRQFDKLMQKASSIIGHAGIGTITMALDNEKPLLVMPRLKKYGEVVNDHQIAFARKFEELGHILVAYNAKDLPDGIRKLKSFIPQKRKANPGAVVDRIGRFLNSLSESRQRQDQHWRWK